MTAVEGKPAPDFELESDSGERVSLSALKGKGVVFTKEPTTIRPGVRVCFIRGPEGVSIELLDRNIT